METDQQPRLKARSLPTRTMKLSPYLCASSRCVPFSHYTPYTPYTRSPHISLAAWRRWAGKECVHPTCLEVPS